MTDLLQGKIDFYDFEINPDTTLNDFEKSIGNKFKKEINPLNENIVNFYLNGKAGLTFYNPKIEYPVYCLYEMEFINVKIVFFHEKISKINFITNLDSFYIDENGKQTYSDAKVRERFEILNNWAITNFGKPTFKDKAGIWWTKDWGRIQPSPFNESGSSTLYIDYQKELKL